MNRRALLKAAAAGAVLGGAGSLWANTRSSLYGLFMYTKPTAIPTLPLADFIQAVPECISYQPGPSTYYDGDGAIIEAS